MKRTNYIKWSRAMIISDLLGTTTWMALTTFMIMAKNAIGNDVIPIFEVIIFMMALVGIKLAHSNWVSLKGGQLASITQESIFLVALYVGLIYTDDLAIAGYIVYGVIIGSALIKEIGKETSRAYEQKEFRSYSGNKALRLIRKASGLTITIGGAIGSGVAVVAISILHINIVSFTMVMLILNILQNVYDYYLWFKYLR